MNRLKTPFCVNLLLLTLLGLTGCGGSRFPTAPVSGNVTLDGKPLTNATVSFEPIAKRDDGVAGEISFGKLDGNGRFTLKTTSGESGAVVGNHRVRINTVREKSKVDTDEVQPYKEVIPSRYNVETKLQFEVPADGTDVANFELHS